MRFEGRLTQLVEPQTSRRQDDNVSAHDTRYCTLFDHRQSQGLVEFERSAAGSPATL